MGPRVARAVLCALALVALVPCAAHDATARRLSSTASARQLWEAAVYDAAAALTDNGLRRASLELPETTQRRRLEEGTAAHFEKVIQR
jgi:hypothetical protein